jgi:hypothetical protein
LLSLTSIRTWMKVIALMCQLKGISMLISKHHIAALAVLVLSSMPAWSRTERITLRGHTYLFDIPTDLKLEGGPPSGFVAYDNDEANGAPDVFVYVFEYDREDWSILADSNPTPIEHRNGVSVRWARVVTEGAASTRACGGKCFVMVKVSVLDSENRARCEQLLNGYVQTLASHSFEAAGASTQNTANAEGAWLIIAGSWPTDQRAKIAARLKLLSKNGIAAATIKTDDHPGLTPGLVAVVLGPFSKDLAQSQLDTVQSLVPDAFIKESN